MRFANNSKQFNVYRGEYTVEADKYQLCVYTGPDQMNFMRKFSQWKYICFSVLTSTADVTKFRLEMYDILSP